MIRPMTCPICNEELPAEVSGDSPVFPFCSRRCKEIDLYRWMKGDYAVVEPMTMEHLLEAEQRSELDLDE